MGKLAASASGLWHTVRGAGRARTDEEHVRSAVAWLDAAQRASGGGGFAHSFSLTRGWEEPYPETTGYLLPSLRCAGTRFGIAEAEPLLHNAARWLASVQGADGSFLDLAGCKRVFDTGQILHGWNDLAEHAPHLVERERHVCTARWIADQQDEDGSFVRTSWRGAARSYYVRVGAALIRAGRLLADAPLLAAGMRNLRWTLAQQEANGFFRHSAFDAGPPFLHTMIYVVEGLLDAHADSHEAAPLEAALRMMEPLRAAAARGVLPRSRYRDDFAPVDRELCLPGLAQWAGACFRLAALGYRDYHAPARAAVAALKAHQIVSRDPALDGGLFGSAPLWGRYMRCAVPNWGVKFLIDALLAHAEQCQSTGRG
jgi:hypothetical protein